jgi:hypothetical protein
MKRAIYCALCGASAVNKIKLAWPLTGERRAIAASYRTSALGTAKPPVEISGWNLQ